MKKIFFVFSLCAFFSSVQAGPAIEIYTCELNEGKTLNDANQMVETFANMLWKNIKNWKISNRQKNSRK